MKKASPFWSLQKSEPNVDQIIRDYIEVYEAFFEQRHLIPADNFCEVAFGELERDPIGQVQRIYDNLSLPEFGYIEPKLSEYVQSIDGYSKNSFPELPSEIRERLGHEWSRCFEEWQYPK